MNKKKRKNKTEIEKTSTLLKNKESNDTIDLNDRSLEKKVHKKVKKNEEKNSIIK